MSGFAPWAKRKKIKREEGGDLIFAVVRFSMDGYHRWEEAPRERKYLGSKHRHRFNIELSVEVEHANRDVEFHDLLSFSKAALLRSWGTRRWGLVEDTVDFGTWSCERIAIWLADTIQARYGKRACCVSVFEDGDVGAVVTRDPVQSAR
jgi:hypothetical protein